MSEATKEVLRYVFGYCNPHTGASVTGSNMPIAGARIKKAAADLAEIGVIRVIKVTEQNQVEFMYPLGTSVAVRTM